MNKIVLTLALATGALFSSAQSNKVVSAWKYLKDYYDFKEVSSLVKAKESIDPASENEQTKGEAKTWLYRGKIYQAIFEQNLKNEIDKQKETDNSKKNVIAYQNVSIAELTEAYKSYSKIKALDAKNAYSQEATEKINQVGRHFENKGIADYNAKRFSEAMPSFESAIEINASLGIVDSINIKNAAIVAEKTGDYNKAKSFYEKLIELKQAKGSTYSSLASIYLILKDSAKAEEAVKKGRALFPDDINLIISETNFFLKTNQSDQALNNLKLAIVKIPNDVNLYLVRGNVYDNMANPKGANGADLNKPANYEELLKNAEEDYKKAIELKPNTFDAIYNLGVLYNNHGVYISKLADAISDQVKFTAENARAGEEFKKALPYLEKALELSPEDKSTMIALKQIYSRTQQKEKLEKINEMLKK